MMNYIASSTFESPIEMLAMRRKRLIQAREFLDMITPVVRRRGRGGLADQCGFDSASLKAAIFQTEMRLASCEPQTWQEALLLCEVLETWLEPGVSLRLGRSITRFIGSFGWQLSQVQEERGLYS